MKLAVFDIGGSAVKYGCWENDNLTKTAQFPTPPNYEGLTKNMRQVINSFANITGVAISAPGAVNTAERKIDGISAVPYLHNFPIFGDLEQTLRLPVAIENDANCAGICEAQQGAGKDTKNMVFVIIGTGVGGSIFIDGKLYKGSHLFGGEFGLMKNWQTKTFSAIGSGVKAAEKYSSLTNQQVNGKQLFTLAKHDEQAKLLVTELYENIANCLYNIQVSLDPEIIIIGGGISARSELIKEVKDRLSQKLHAENIATIMPKVTACHYLNNANLIGAAHNFLLQQHQ